MKYWGEIIYWSLNNLIFNTFLNIIISIKMLLDINKELNTLSKYYELYYKHLYVTISNTFEIIVFDHYQKIETNNFNIILKWYNKLRTQSSIQ